MGVCGVAEKEILDYSVVDPQENCSVSNIGSYIMRLRRDGHCPCLHMTDMKQKQKIKQIYLRNAVYAVEEASRRALDINTPRKFYIKKQYRITVRSVN